MTPGDLNISYGVYEDNGTEWEYGFIGSDGFWQVGGDLHCLTCHPWSGEGDEFPTWPDMHTRFFRTWLDVPADWPREGGE